MIEAKTLVQIVEMGPEDTKKLLERVRYGHLACTRDEQPYVVPIHYAYKDPDVFIFTTEGKKTGIIKDNPKVCLQVEEVIYRRHWQSVIVTGEAERLTERKEIDGAMEFITAVNPTLTPAISIHWLDQWIRSNVDVVYRITPATITGRTTLERSTPNK